MIEQPQSYLDIWNFARSQGHIPIARQKGMGRVYPQSQTEFLTLFKLNLDISSFENSLDSDEL